MLEAQAGFDTARANRSIAQRQVEDAFQALYTLTNREYRRWKASATPRRCWRRCQTRPRRVDTATRQNLNLLAVNYAVTAAEETLRQRRAGHAPTLDAVASYRKGDNDALGFTNPDSTGLSPV